MAKLMVEFKVGDKWVLTEDFPTMDMAIEIEAFFHKNNIKARIVVQDIIQRYAER